MLKSSVLRLTLAAVCAVALAPLHMATADENRARDRRESSYPRMSLQAQAVSEVAEDTVEIVLAAEIEGADQSEVNRRLAERLNPGMEDARKASGVTVHSGGFRVWPNTDRDGRITGWRGRAELIIESQDIARAVELAARLGNTLSIASVSFSLSPKARAEEEKRLLKQAADAFAQRAEDAAKAFGFSGYRILKLDLGGSGAVHTRRPEMAMLRASYADAMPAPQLEPGQATVTVEVRGEVVLETRR